MNNYLKSLKTEVETFDDFILDFGKHKGKKISEVYVENKGYLEWLMENHKDSSLKLSISNYLQSSKKYIKNYLITSEGKISYEMYRYASSIFVQHLRKIQFFGHLGSNASIDHKFSVKEAYERNIDLKVVNNTNNLEVIHKSKNSSKGANCSISIMELNNLDKCDEFSKFFTGEKQDELIDLTKTVKEQEKYIKKLEEQIKSKLKLLDDFDITRMKQTTDNLIKIIDDIKKFND